MNTTDPKGVCASPLRWNSIPLLCALLTAAQADAAATLVESARSANWYGSGMYFCDQPPIGECVLTVSGGSSSDQVGDFFFENPAAMTLGAGQTSHVGPDGITGSGLVSVTGLRVRTGETVANSTLKVVFELQQPHEYQLTASSQAVYAADHIHPRHTDELRLVGSDFPGWAKIESVPIGFNGASETFWTADHAGILQPGQYSFLADFAASVVLPETSFYPVGGQRSFNYSLKLTPVPEPAGLGVSIWIGLAIVRAARGRRALSG